MLTQVLRREGFTDNHKRIERVYREERLQIKVRRRRRRYVARPRVERVVTGPDDRWAGDFIHDGLLDGRPFRCLTLIDEASRQVPHIEVGRSIGGKGVVEVLERLRELGRKPRELLLDNGPEFTSRALDQWSYENNVALSFIQPGKPTQNAFIESFNGTFREECLNEHWFTDIHDAREKIEAWRRDYNEARPHTSLGGQTPKEAMEEQLEAEIFT